MAVRLDQYGREIPDDKPLALPSGFKRPETLAEQVRRLVRSERFRQEVEAQGFESFEEAEDFEVGDDIDPHTKYEEIFDPALGRSLTPDEFMRNEAEYRKRYEEAARKEVQREEVSDKIRSSWLGRMFGRPPAKQSGRGATDNPKGPPGDDV